MLPRFCPRFYILITTLCWLLSACSQVSRKSNSIFVLMVDQLSVSDINCSREKNSHKSGFDILCSEAIRFTHAYTTSTMNQSAMTSLLTGQYPYEHHVRDNSNEGLNNPQTSIATQALKKNFRTSLFAGGPPIARKANLQAGFETFDDHYNTSPMHFYRSAPKVFKQLESWIDSTGSQNVISFAYLPDLDFPFVATYNELGEPRPLSVESQIESVDESIYAFFQYLKKKNIYDKSTIIVVGLRGRPLSDQITETNATNLNSSNTQVALFIKPQLPKPRDQALTWNIDADVSLADVGRTLFDLIDAQAPTNDTSDFLPVFSLAKNIANPKEEFDSERFIAIESGWTKWRENLSVRTALRQQNLLYIHDSKPKIFNNLIDYQETQSISADDLSVQAFAKAAQSALRSLGWQAYDGQNHKPSLYQKGVRLSLLSHNPGEMIKKIEYDNSLAAQTVFVFYDELKKLLQLSKSNHNKSLKQYVEHKTLPNKNDFEDICIKSFVKNKFSADCQDPLLFELAEWKNSDSKKIPQSILWTVNDIEVNLANASHGWEWDTSDSEMGRQFRFIEALSVNGMSNEKKLILNQLRSNKEDTNTFFFF